MMPGQTFTMDIRLKLNEEFQNIDPTTIALEPVVIGGVGREVPPQGQIHGRKFWDQNGNGQWDEGEPALGGWVIYLDVIDKENDDGVPDMETKTNEDGGYWFMTLPEGPFVLWEEPQPGWVQTWPTDATGDATNYHDNLGRNEVIERGFDFGNQLVAAEIHGVKFNDRNNNGERDEGEEGLPGWEIVLDLDQDGAGDVITTTNRDGAYWFMDLPAGTFDLWEVLQPGWVQTMPEGGIHIPNIQIGEIQEHFHFGNHLTAAEIHGRKIHDLNGNAQADEGEPGLPGWTIYLDVNEDGVADQSTVTNEFGAYWFTNLPAGPYYVWEETRPGWAHKWPPNLEGYFVELAVGDILREMHFGNRLEAAEIHGRKYNDLNNSGGWDEGEPFLADWEITLDLGDDGTVDLTTTTNADGAYWFLNLPNGPFALEEVEQTAAGWVVTEPVGGAYTGELNAGDVLRGMLFGNYQSGPALPDLTISLGTMGDDPDPGNCAPCVQTVTFTMTNNGGVVPDAFTTEIRLQSASGQGVPNGIVNGAQTHFEPAGFSAEVSITVLDFPVTTAERCFSPNCLITATIDLNNNVTETDETNNVTTRNQPEGF